MENSKKAYQGDVLVHVRLKSKEQYACALVTSEHVREHQDADNTLPK